MALNYLSVQKQNDIWQVGITGGIGAGKSIICKIFSLIGIPIYDADSMAKNIMVEDQAVINSIRQLFGREAYILDRELNRSYIAEKVFHNPEMLAKLNAIVHPKVNEHYKAWVSEHSAKHTYLIKEAALLLETGSYSQLDYIINVSAPVELRVKRVLERDTHRDQSQVEAILQKQWSDTQRANYVQATIVNDGKQALIPKILALHQYFINFELKQG